MTDTPLHRFLGGPPAAVLAKLVVLSLVVGAAMVFFGVTPRDLVESLRETLRNLVGGGLENLRLFALYIGYGAIVVVPLFVLVRLLRLRRPG